MLYKKINHSLSEGEDYNLKSDGYKFFPKELNKKQIERLGGFISKMNLLFDLLSLSNENPKMLDSLAYISAFRIVNSNLSPEEKKEKIYLIDHMFWEFKTKKGLHGMASKMNFHKEDQVIPSYFYTYNDLDRFDANIFIDFIEDLSLLSSEFSPQLRDLEVAKKLALYLNDNDITTQNCNLRDNFIKKGISLPLLLDEKGELKYIEPSQNLETSLEGIISALSLKRKSEEEIPSNSKISKESKGEKPSSSSNLKRKSEEEIFKKPEMPSKRSKTKFYK